MKTIIITGGNSGLGFECAKNILSSENEYLVILACRDLEKAKKAKDRLVAETGNNNAEVMELDLSSFGSIRNFANNFGKASFPPLYSLVCNAGLSGMHSGKTVEGYELIFGTNHLGHFLLTALLLPQVIADGRIVVVSSDMHNPPNGITYPGAKMLADPDNGLGNKYPLSKLCNLYFVYTLARKLAEMQNSITVNAFNPGLLTDTNFSAGHKDRFTKEFLESIKDRIGYLPVSSKALSDMVTNSDFKFTGKYNDRGTVISSSELSYNEENQRDLWETSIKLTVLSDKDIF